MTISHSPERLQGADLFAATFAGRLDAYSVHNGDTWQAIRQPLTGQRILHAFDTGVPLSGYFLDRDSATHIAALDLDLENGMDLGRQFVEHIRKLGGVAYLEPSRRGAHVWIVISERRPAIVIRSALKTLVHDVFGDCAGSGQAPVPHPKTGRPSCPECHSNADRTPVATHADPRIELRPGSDRLGTPKEGEEELLGHCLRMPTMPHPETGKRYGLFSSDGEKLGGKLTEIMLAIDYCPVEVIEDAAMRAPLAPLAVPRSLGRPWADEEVSESASDIMRELWGVMESLTPGRGFHCPAHPDKNKSAMVHRSDERVICWSPECVLFNNGSGRGTHELRKLAPGRH